MKKRLICLLAGLLVGALIPTGIAFAKNSSVNIEAFYRDIKLFVDGVKVDPKDANGAAVEPFIYNGTTYLPVRAVGEAMGKTVSWDGKTSTVYVGEVPGKDTYFTDICKPYSQTNISFIDVAGETMSMGGKKYYNGFYLYNYGSVFYNLNGDYESMTFEVGSTNNYGGTIQIMVDDYLVEEIHIKSNDLPKTVTVPLDYGLKLEIRKESGDGNLGLANIVVK